jgi:hypothetical protein
MTDLDMTDLDRETAPIPETARRQAQALLAARLDAAARPLSVPTRSISSPRWVLRMALGASSLLMVSGAWAWVHHVRAPAPPLAKPILPSPVPRVTAIVKTPAPIVAIQTAPPHPRKRTKTNPLPAATSNAPPDQLRFDEEPMGDVIFGRAPRTQPPLFTVEEYKARGVLVH